MLGHMECVRCGCEVERETDSDLLLTYPWYCPACDENKFKFEVEFVENAPFEQVRWGFVDEDTIVIAWSVEDVLSIAPDLTVEDARDVLAMALHNHDANIGIRWDVLEVWADFKRSEKGGDE
jgi:predicted  nucleic acid-binding Zn-ribbon protein